MGDGAALVRASITTRHRGCSAMNRANCSRDSFLRNTTDPSLENQCCH
jgi:hypothetical protein